MRLLLSIITVLVASAQVHLDYSGRQGRVQFRIVDPFGRRLENALVTISGADGQFQTNPETLTVDLPYGRYRIRATKSGFRSRDQDLVVETAYAALVVPLAIGDIEQSIEPTLVSGQLPVQVADKTCRILRLVPMILPEQAKDTVVSADGKFLLSNVSAGAYAAILLGETGICGTYSANVLHRYSQTLTIKEMK